MNSGAVSHSDRTTTVPRWITSLPEKAAFIRGTALLAGRESMAGQAQWAYGGWFQIGPLIVTFRDYAVLAYTLD